MSRAVTVLSPCHCRSALSSSSALLLSPYRLIVSLSAVVGNSHTDSVHRKQPLRTSEAKDIHPTHFVRALLHLLFHTVSGHPVISHRPHIAVMVDWRKIPVTYVSSSPYSVVIPLLCYHPMLSHHLPCSAIISLVLPSSLLYHHPRAVSSFRHPPPALLHVSSPCSVVPILCHYPRVVSSLLSCVSVHLALLCHHPILCHHPYSLSLSPCRVITLQLCQRPPCPALSSSLFSVIIPVSCHHSSAMSVSTFPCYVVVPILCHYPRVVSSLLSCVSVHLALLCHHPILCHHPVLCHRPYFCHYSRVVSSLLSCVSVHLALLCHHPILCHHPVLCHRPYFCHYSRVVSSLLSCVSVHLALLCHHPILCHHPVLCHRPYFCHYSRVVSSLLSCVSVHLALLCHHPSALPSGPCSGVQGFLLSFCVCVCLKWILELLLGRKMERE